MLDNNDFALASADDTSVVVLEKLSSHPQPQVREAVAKNQNTPTKVLLKLGKEFPNAITANLLNKFANGGYWMHKEIAQNPQAPSAILEKLAGENVKEIRNLVKNHPNISETAIAIINFIEGKPGTSIDLLEQLASDRRASVRQLVAAHPSTPVKVLENLAQDTDKYVSFKAASNPNATSTVLKFFVANDDLARLVAADPLSESSLLGELFIKARINKDVEMQRAIASNPNTPTQWLIELAYLFPEEFFSNPAYDLSIVQNIKSNTAYDLSTLQRVNFNLLLKSHLLLKLVCASNAPTSFLEFAAGICETNIKRIRNDKYFGHFSLEQQYSIKYLRMEIGYISTFSFEDFWRWREILIIIASHQNTSIKKLFDLSTSGEDIVTELAQLRLDCPNDDMNFWDQVALNKEPNFILFIPRRLMFKLVQLPEISTNFLKAASELEKFPGILNIIANHPKTPKEVLDKLAENNNSFIAEAAKLHINYAGELESGWHDLAESKIHESQMPTSTDHDEIIKLRLRQVGAAVYPSERVRVGLAINYNISHNSLDKLIDDRHPEVRAAALANPQLDSMLREKLATLENPNLSSLDLLELANSEHTAVRAKVVQHPNVDGSILTKLADDKLIVRLAVAKHPKTPAEILTRFTKHPDRRLPLAVAQNPGAPKDLLILLATQPGERGGFQFNPLNLAAVKSLLIQEPEAAIPFLDRCLKFPERPSFARFSVLMNPRIPSSFLARYYKSWFWPERYAIAQNPNTDRDIIEQLTQDPNSIVRAAARDSLK
jgi:hypothetical protein